MNKLVFLMIAVLLLPVTVLAVADFQDISITFPKGYQGSNVSTTFVVKNTGTVPLTNVRIIDNIHSKYSITYTNGDLGTLNASQEKTVEVKATIPTYEEFGIHSIGTATLTSNEHNESFVLNIEVGRRLAIKKVEIVIDGESDTLNKDDEISNDKASPGDEIKLNIEVRNEFSQDIDIDDITVTATIVGADQDDEDLEEESDSFDLESDKSKSTQLLFTLPLEVEERDYDIEIYAQGESTDGTHEDSWVVHFDLDKKAHDIIINKAVLTEETVNCGDTASLDVELLNIGANYEEEVALEAKNADLGLNFEEHDISLVDEPWEDDTRHEKKIDFKVPSNARPGTYPIVVEAFYNRDAVDDFKTLNLIVNCEKKVEERPPVIPNETAEAEQPVKVNKTEENETGGTEPETIEEVEVTASVESPLIKNPAVFALLVTGNLVIIGLVLFFLIKVFSFQVLLKHLVFCLCKNFLPKFHQILKGFSF